MTSSNFTSGEALFSARGRDQSLPVTGEKQAEASGSWLENKRIDSLLHDHQMLLAEPKFARRDQLASGEWLAESRMVRVIHETGKFWQYMGAETDIGKCLYPEEALYLIDTGELEVTFGGLALSVQQAQTLMLQDAHHLDQYHVYAHLSRTGYKVVRHQTHLVFTSYEKQIRLDQHQISKKGTKLKLKNKESSADTEDIEIIEIKNENLDDAVKELYAVLGSAAKNPYKALKDMPDDLSDTEKVFPIGTKESYEDKKKNFHEEISPYEKKRREILEMFPSVHGVSLSSINVEASELIPRSSIPTKKTYEISLEALNYYSLYKDSPQEWQNNFQDRQAQNYRDRRGRGARWRKRDTNQPWHQNDRESDSRNWRQDNSNFRPEWDRNSARNRDNGERKNDNRWDSGSGNSYQTERDRQWVNMNDRGVHSWSGGVGYGVESIGISSYGRREPERQQHDDNRWHNGSRNSFNSERDGRWENKDDRGMKSWCNGVNYGTESQGSSFYGRREPEWQQHDNRGNIGSRDRQWDISDDRGGKSWHVGVGSGMESHYSSSNRRSESEWQQHDDRWSQPSFSLQNNRPAYGDQHGKEFFNNISSESQSPYHEGNNSSVCFDASDKGAVDYSKPPKWKTRQRRRQRKEVGSYPSCLVRLNTKVSSWKEYKKLVSETSAEKLLANGPARALWRGRTTPLIKPAMATSTQSVLSGCTINDETIDLSTYQEKFPRCMQLRVHYDIYLPTVPYKKSNPTTPSKRITVMRDASMPTPGQILDVTSRFHDDVPVVSAVVIYGEVRLYTLTPVTLSQPKPSR